MKMVKRELRAGERGGGGGGFRGEKTEGEREAGD